MALRKQTHERIYVEDDLPSFIKAGPSLNMMHHAAKHGILSGAPKDAAAEARRNSTLSNGYRSNDLAPETLSASPAARASRHTMSSHKGWDYHFLLISVGVMVALNIMLYVSFNSSFNHSALQRSAKSPLILTHAASPQTLEDRIVTLRFAPQDDTAPTASAQQDPKHLYVPVIP